MDRDTLYDILNNKSLKKRLVFGKEFILINKKDFVEYKKYLDGPLKIGGKNNYRTKNIFKHIHFVEGEKTVSLHYDHGNVWRFFPLGIVHFFVDVVPYFL